MTIHRHIHSLMMHYTHYIYYAALSFSLLFLFPSSQARSQSPQPPDPEQWKLVGIWQDSPEMGAGWTDVFVFTEDGHFQFYINQMSCASRTLSYSGRYSLGPGEDGKELKLLIDEETRLVGGETVPADGSCYSDSMIVNGVEDLIEYKRPHVLNIPISEIKKKEKDDVERRQVVINDVEYWQFSEDPTAYR